MTALRQRMLEDLQIRNYSPTTVRAYILQVAQFAKHFGKSPDQLGAEHIRAYQLFLVKEGRLSQSAYIQVVCALRFLYTQTLNRQVGIERIPFPRHERKLPIILSREEVQALLEAPRSLRHRTLLTTMYAAGPRVSEVARLRVGDIDSARNVIWIRGGKGHKDRQTLLPPRLLELLRSYWRWKRPGEWLFPGSQPDQPISVKAIFLACRNAARKAGITKASTRILCGTPSPHICSKLAAISARFKSCWDTPGWKRPRAICMSPTWRCAPPPAPWNCWTWT